MLLRNSIDRSRLFLLSRIIIGDTHLIVPAGLPRQGLQLLAEKRVPTILRECKWKRTVVFQAESELARLSCQAPTAPAQSPAQPRTHLIEAFLSG